MSPGTVLGGRYRLEDLLSEHAGARFWRATDTVLSRSVGIHAVASSDPRAEAILEAARRSAIVTDPHFLRVLDCENADGLTWVVNEWGTGESLDVMVEQDPLSPGRAAWICREVAEAIAAAHARGVAHGRLNPENVMVTEGGAVKVIGFVVYAAFTGPRPAHAGRYGSVSDQEADVIDLAGILYTALTARWPGVTESAVPPAPREGRRLLRPRQVRAGVPRTLDAICDRVLNKEASEHILPIETAFEIAAVLRDYVGDPATTPALVMEELEDEPTGEFPEVAAPVAPEPETIAEVEPGPDPMVDPEATMAAPPQLDDTMPRVYAGLPVTDLQEPDAWEPEASLPASAPPPFEQPVERPLFADTERRVPDPAPDAPTAPAGYWPFEDDGRPLPTEAPPRHRPPARWRRRITLGVLIALLLVAMYVAFDLGRDDSPSSSGAHHPSTSSGPTGPLVKIAVIRDFDPEGSPPRENPDQAANADDGNPATGWQTNRYYGNPRLGGLKSGVGLLLDLGSDQKVASVEISLVGEPTSLEIYASAAGLADPPTELADTHRITGLTARGTSAVARFDTPIHTRYLIVWLTKLPAVAGGYRGEITEVKVRS